MGLQQTPRTLENIWHGCVFFFGARLAQSGSRLWWLWRKGRLDVAADGEDSGSEGSGQEGEDPQEKGGGTAAAAAAAVVAAAEGTAPGAAGAHARRPHARAGTGSPDPSGGQLELSP